MRKVWLIALGGLALCGQAQASTTISPDSGTTYPYQRWVDEARVPTPDVTLTVVEAPCPYEQATGCTRDDASTIWLNPVLGHRHEFLHELGHQFDYHVMTDEARAQFLAIRHDTRAWRSPPDSPHEQFAEAYALCAQPQRANWHQAAFRYWQGRSAHRAVCGLIRSLP